MSHTSQYNLATGWSLEAVVVYARAAAEYADVTVAEIYTRVAEKHDITI